MCLILCPCLLASLSFPGLRRRFRGRERGGSAGRVSHGPGRARAPQAVTQSKGSEAALLFRHIYCFLSFRRNSLCKNSENPEPCEKSTHWHDKYLLFPLFFCHSGFFRHSGESRNPAQIERGTRTYARWRRQATARIFGRPPFPRSVMKEREARALYAGFPPAREWRGGGMGIAEWESFPLTSRLRLPAPREQCRIVNERPSPKIRNRTFLLCFDRRLVQPLKIHLVSFTVAG